MTRSNHFKGSLSSYDFFFFKLKFNLWHVRILPIPRHCVEPGAVIRHAAPLTVTKITPTPTKITFKINKNHVKRKFNRNFNSPLTSQWDTQILYNFHNARQFDHRMKKNHTKTHLIRKCFTPCTISSPNKWKMNKTI